MIKTLLDTTETNRIECVMSGAYLGNFPSEIDENGTYASTHHIEHMCEPANIPIPMIFHIMYDIS